MSYGDSRFAMVLTTYLLTNYMPSPFLLLLPYLSCLVGHLAHDLFVECPREQCGLSGAWRTQGRGTNFIKD